ncbi:hypothetical protein ElP_72060 (plasmid) [Tautonia plasticadhaerens]|uniref:FG-GAP repeat protein n=2 Tax=Tautonia plasticadhaerens TaxID=2527974 RepID=A0A518HEH4_9BACT|nr:hypothetical protein ElP_72060 [Tautonia plasticadhaerens]
MAPLNRAGVSAALLAFGVTARAQEAVPYDTAPDVPKGAATDLFHAPIRLSAADGVIDSGPSWGHSGPWVEDVDGDGRRDLVVGDFSGLFRLYRNEGTDREPRYAVAINLKAGDADAKVPIY